MSFIKYLFFGICIGMANIIPGVSGSTIAVVLGIYDKFVNAITFNIKKLKANWRFVVPILIGLILGILLFSKAIEFLYGHFPLQSDFFFTGLILGSIPMLAGYFISESNEKQENLEKTAEDNDGQNKMSASTIKKVISVGLCIFLGLLLILFFGYLESITASVENVIGGDLPALTVRLGVKIFIGGILAAIAMIIPGISGSLLMLVLGIYPIIITSISKLFYSETFLNAFILLLPSVAGILIGLFGGAKLISILFKKFPTQTYAVIFGLIIGSAIMMFPGFSLITGALQLTVCFLCLAVGFFMAYISSKFSNE